MGSSIDVLGGPVHGRIELSHISDVNERWRVFLEELMKPGDHGVSNNQIKELVNRWAQAGEALQRVVNALPSQGRNIGLQAIDYVRVSELLGGKATPDAKF